MTTLAENPLLIKHMRSRLRRQHMIPTLVVLLLLGICIWWSGYQNDFRGGTFSVLLFLQGAVLLLGGTSQVASSVSRAHASGILDFHRSSPLPAREVAIGFLLGAPIREYIGFAVLTPFTLLAAASGPPGLWGAICVLAVTLVSGLLFHALALVFGLLAGRSRSAGAGPIGLLLVSSCCAPLVYLGYALPALWTPAPAYAEAMYATHPGWTLAEVVHPTFFGAPWPLTIQSLIYQLPVLAFVLLAAVRRMTSERANLYSKPAAVLLLVMLSVLGMGGLIGHPEVTTARAIPLILCVMLIVGCAVSMAVTPDWLAYSAGLRRATRAGAARPGPWTDEASNRIATIAMAAITALAGAITAGLVRSDTDTAWISTAVAGSAVLAFGFALQWFALTHRRRAIPYFVLFLFLWWALPVVVGTLFGVASAGEWAAQVTGLSPFAGIIRPTALAVGGNIGLAVVFGALLWIKEHEVGRGLVSPMAATVGAPQSS